jgi:hypothetical protein
VKEEKEMDDYTMMQVIRKVSEEAERHQHSDRCHSCPVHRSPYATGSPPHRYLNKFARMAQKLGYTVMKSWQPREINGPGCDGFTTGWVPVGAPCERNAIKIAKEMPPAHEFVVAAHEMSHAFLDHPVKNEQDAMWQAMMAKRRGTREDFTEEVSAQLAAIAAASAAGLEIAPASLHYLHDRIKDHRRYIGETEQYPAFQSARVLRDCLA